MKSLRDLFGLGFGSSLNLYPDDKSASPLYRHSPALTAGIQDYTFQPVWNFSIQVISEALEAT